METTNTQAAENQAASAVASASAAAAVATADSIVANAPIELYTKKEITFHFKKDELGNKRPSVALDIPVLTLAGVANVINHGTDAEKDLLLSALEDVIYAQARQQVNENVNISQETLDRAKLTWDFISSIPKSERRGAGISKETWEAFAADYISIMPALISRDVEKVSNAATIFTKRLQPVKASKTVVKQLKDYLDIWFTNTSNTDELVEVYEFLSKKADEFLAADEAKLLENI